MPESATEHRRWPKRAAWLLILAVLLLLGVLFWERAATEVCLSLAWGGNRQLREVGLWGLEQLGARALPHLVAYLDPPSVGPVTDRPGREVLAMWFLEQEWSALTSDELTQVAKRCLRPTIMIRPYYVWNHGLTYLVLLERPAYAELPGHLLQRVEVLDAGEVVDESEIRRQLPAALRARAWKTTLGGPPQDLAFWLEWVFCQGGWRAVGEASRQAQAGLWRDPFPGGVTGVIEEAALGWLLQQAGRGTLRVSVALVDPRLPEPLVLAEAVQTVTTVASPPSGYFFPVSSPAIDEAMRESLYVEVEVAKEGDGIWWSCRERRAPPLPFAYTAHIRIRETGEEIERQEDVPKVWLDPILADRFQNTVEESGELLECLPLEPGRTYHLQVVLKSDPERAWLDPRVTKYWAGPLESDWVEVTVPEREEQ